MDRHLAVLTRDRDHRVVLDVQLLLVPDPILPFEDHVRGGEAGVEVAVGDLVAGEEMVRGLRIEDRRQRLGDQPDVGLEPADRLAIGSRQERDGFGVVADLAAHGDEDGLVLLDRADEVLAGDVGGGHDHDLRPVHVGVQLDGDKARARLGRADRRPVPGAGENQIVGILGGTRELARALAATGEADGTAGGRGASLEDERIGGRPIRRYGWARHRTGRHRTTGSSGKNCSL